MLISLFFATVNCASFNPEEFCSLLTNGTRIKDPRACNAWITCIDGEAVSGTCEDNLFYDRNTFKCVNSSTIDCLSSNPCAALNGEIGFNANPYNCSTYYYCNKGSATPGYCDTDYTFDPGTKVCVRGYPCKTSNPESYCNILPDGVFIKDPNNCDGYKLCWKGNVLSRSCPAGYYYDAVKGDCDYPSNVNCQSTTVAPDLPASELCNQTGIFVSDRQSCNGFYYCRAATDGTTGIVLQHGVCSSGRFFNAANGGECVPRTDIVCNYNRCVGLASDKIELANESNDGCHGYTVCQDGVKIGNGTCPDNGYFDELKQLCTSSVVNFPACVLS